MRETQLSTIDIYLVNMYCTKHNGGDQNRGSIRDPIAPFRLANVGELKDELLVFFLSGNRMQKRPNKQGHSQC